MTIPFMGTTTLAKGRPWFGTTSVHRLIFDCWQSTTYSLESLMKTSTPIPALTTITLATALTLAAPLVLAEATPNWAG